MTGEMYLLLFFSILYSVVVFRSNIDTAEPKKSHDSTLISVRIVVDAAAAYTSKSKSSIYSFNSQESYTDTRFMQATKDQKKVQKHGSFYLKLKVV